MSVYVPPKVTWQDLLQFPEDGKRYEIIGGELFVSAAPTKRHQTLLKRLFNVFFVGLELSGWGRVYFAPVDVKFSDEDVVEPDLIAIREDRMHIYADNPVTEAPDIVLEVISPTSIRHDEVRKANLYAANGVPEYWIASSFRPSLRLLALRDGVYVEVDPEPDGRLRSTVAPNLILDPATLLADLDN
jgi:Uma2 family endonuclease